MQTRFDIFFYNLGIGLRLCKGFVRPSSVIEVQTYSREIAITLYKLWGVRRKKRVSNYEMECKNIVLRILSPYTSL